MPRTAKGSSSGVACERVSERLDQFLAQIDKVAWRLQLVEAPSWSSHHSPIASSTSALGRDDTRVGLDQAPEVAPLGHDVGKLQVVVVLGDEEVIGSRPCAAKRSALASTSRFGMPPCRCARTSCGSGSGVVST